MLASKMIRGSLCIIWKRHHRFNLIQKIYTKHFDKASTIKKKIYVSTPMLKAHQRSEPPLF